MQIFTKKRKHLRSRAKRFCLCRGSTTLFLLHATTQCQKLLPSIVLSKQDWQERVPSCFQENDFSNPRLDGSKNIKNTTRGKLAQDAYKKELRIVEKKIEIKDVADSVSSALAYASLSKSRKIKELASEMNRILTQKNVDLALARSKAQEINRKYQQLLKNKTKSPKVLKETAVNHETIKDLKKRLGTKFPKTLEHLEDAISEYEKKQPFLWRCGKNS